MLKITQIFIFALSILTNIFAQDTLTSKFATKNKPCVTIYSNYHTNFSDISKMEIQRAVFGYEYNFSENYLTKIQFDVCETNGTYSALLKIAEMQYKTQKTVINIGLISTTQFKIQEAFWDYRYIFKSFQDEYKMNASSDLGASICYKINNNFSVDAIIQNGEGYKHIEDVVTNRVGAGATVNPFGNLTLRIYSDISSKPNANRINFASFAGYKFKEKLKIAAEYNLQVGSNFEQQKEYSGISAYSTYFINEKFNIFARFDLVNSNPIISDCQPWNINNDGSRFIAGIEHEPIKGIRVSLNYRNYLPQTANNKLQNLYYINFEYKIN